MNTRASFLIVFSMAFVGAGCFQSSTTVNQAYSTSTDTYTATDDQAATSVEPTASSTSSISTQISMNSEFAFPGVLSAAETSGKLIHLNTTKGEIVFELLPNEGPNAASNFVYLANKKFYDGLTFHRVVPDFVIQGGDPEGTGMGGPGYSFQDDPVKLSYDEGIVAMANAGPNTNGSQFFIMLKNTPLPPSYSIFGRVVKGLDVVHKIGVGDKMTTVTVEDQK